MAGLQIEESLALERRMWAAERAGWLAMAGIIVAALLGFFGGAGPIALSRASSEDGLLTVDYHRFGRAGASLTLALRFAPEAVEDSELRLLIEESYLDGVQVEGVTPEPDSAIAEGDGLVYVFTVDDPARTPTVTIRLTADGIGPVSGLLGLEGGDPLRLSHFFYP